MAKQEVLPIGFLPLCWGISPLIDAFAPLPAAATEARAHQDSIQRLNELPSIEPKVVEDHGDSTKPHTPAKTNSVAASKQKSSTPCDSKKAPTDQSFEIRFESVSFSYSQTGRLLLDNLSLSIPAQEKIAILGKSGAGKSTLASLIRGDLVPAKGTVTIVDPKGKELHTSALNNKASDFFGVIQQRAYVFNATLRDNLLIGNPHANDEELIETLHKVELGSLLERYLKLILLLTKRDFVFLVGERHRIALARVLLQDVSYSHT